MTIFINVSALSICVCVCVCGYVMDEWKLLIKVRIERSRDQIMKNVFKFYFIEV